MSRLDQQCGPLENIAAARVKELAEEIQELIYYGDGQGIPPVTVCALQKAYRVVKGATIFYRGDDHPLVWEPPDFKFRPRTK